MDEFAQGLALLGDSSWALGSEGALGFEVVPGFTELRRNLRIVSFFSRPSLDWGGLLYGTADPYGRMTTSLNGSWSPSSRLTAKIPEESEFRWK